MFCTVVPDSPFRRATDLEKAQYDLSGWQIGASLKADDLALLERVAATISCDGTNRYMAHFRATSPVTAVAGVSAGPFQSAELALAFIREETAA